MLSLLQEEIVEMQKNQVHALFYSISCLYRKIIVVDPEEWLTPTKNQGDRLGIPKLQTQGQLKQSNPRNTKLQSRSELGSEKTRRQVPLISNLNMSIGKPLDHLQLYETPFQNRNP